MEFITKLDDIPLTRSDAQLLKRYAKAIGKNEKDAAGHALSNYLHDMGALEMRVEEARKAAREPEPSHGQA